MPSAAAVRDRVSSNGVKSDGIRTRGDFNRPRVHTWGSSDSRCSNISTESALSGSASSTSSRNTIKRRFASPSSSDTVRNKASRRSDREKNGEDDEPQGGHGGEQKGPSASLTKSFPPQQGGMELIVLRQPEGHHRARYQKEGSRGCIKDRTGNSCPALQLKGIITPSTIQIFVVTETGKIRPHPLYRACRVGGKRCSPARDHIIDNINVLELEVMPENGGTIDIDCLGILKLRNADLEMDSEFVEVVGKKKKREPKVRLVFRAVTKTANGYPLILQTTSTAICCTPSPGMPEIHRSSHAECTAPGGLEVVIIGRNFLKDDSKFFVSEQTEDGDTIWEKEIQTQQEHFHHVHIVGTIPPYRDLFITKPVEVSIIIKNKLKISEPYPFKYMPDESVVRLLMTSSVASVPAADLKPLDTLPPVLSPQKAPPDRQIYSPPPTPAPAQLQQSTVEATWVSDSNGNNPSLQYCIQPPGQNQPIFITFPPSSQSAGAKLLSTEIDGLLQSFKLPNSLYDAAHMQMFLNGWNNSQSGSASRGGSRPGMQYGGYAAGPPPPFYGGAQQPPYGHGPPQQQQQLQGAPRIPFAAPPYGPPRGGMPMQQGYHQQPSGQFAPPGQFFEQQPTFYPSQSNPDQLSNVPPGMGVNGPFSSQTAHPPPFGGPPGMRAVPPPPVLRGPRAPRPISYAPADSKEAYDPEVVVTCFIGNIDERVTENLMRTLLNKCGAVANWKRVHGANNKLQAFGFCEFLNAEGALRAVRLLDKLLLGAKELQVKIGNKQHPLVLAYRNEMKARLGSSADEEDVDEPTMLVDANISESITLLVKDYEGDLSKPLPEDNLSKLKRKSDKDASIEEIEMEEEKRQLISREIQNFRETYKGSDEVLEERIKAAGRAQRKNSPEGRESPGATSVVSAENSVTSANLKRVRRSRSASVVSSSSAEVLDAPTRRRDNRRLAEQDKQYQELLEEWTSREKRKAKDQEKDDEKEKLKRIEEKKTSKRLIRVYEDYDDDKMDEEYYRGAALSRLLKDRKKEMEADARDREKEAKLLEDIKQKLIADGHPEVEAHVHQLEMKQNEHMLSKSFKEALVDAISRDAPPVGQAPSAPPSKTSSKHDVTAVVTRDASPIKSEQSILREPNPTVSFQQAPSRLVKKHAGEVFGNSDEEGEKDDHGERRKRLFRFDDETEKKRRLAEEKKIQAKKLIESIPTKKEELFEYPISWGVLDKNLMNGRVKPWISKKVGEYMGEEEQSLIDFIAQKVVAQVNPVGLITEIAVVLDEDAEIFVVKLWRLLIYETEMKKLVAPRD
ncbi:Nuclear factor of activated T-cells 5 [Hypsibius exemplaris]|uniref:Nuclear factor of activated T-cells 5 n=1 Tax=Hypsibius exemplaris TaxID=2072580 RepID=A0A1W0WT37_HYPEX|nr:Nuclear factor of activated T-cells 5 [Hypsibius exemplaris]